MHIPDIIIAIDGYSSTGKSTFAKLIASEFGFLYLDSGALYRGVTLYAMEHGIIKDDNSIDLGKLKSALTGLDIRFRSSDKGSLTCIGDRCVEKEIRTLAVSDKVSPIAAVPEVREYVDRKLREFGKKKRIVMDGRDIGTTVFPEAELKIFMTASPEVRAERRLKELLAKGENVSYEDVLHNLAERDRIDSSRETSPLAKADDALILDNSDMTLDDQIKWVKAVLSDRFGNHAEKPMKFGKS